MKETTLSINLIMDNFPPEIQADIIEHAAEEGIGNMDMACRLYASVMRAMSIFEPEQIREMPEAIQGKLARWQAFLLAQQTKENV